MYDDVRRAAKGEYELFCRAKAKEHHNWSRDVSVADGDELKAFKASYGRFEHLSTVYRAYIAIPASSAGAESLFSKAGRRVRHAGKPGRPADCDAGSPSGQLPRFLA